MPEEIKEALTRVARSLPPVAWRSAEDLRRRAGARRLRRVAVTVVGLALVLAVGVGPVRNWLHSAGTGAGAGTTAGSPGADGPRCPGGEVPAKVELPEIASISLSVYNGTTLTGLAAEVGTQLRNRRFVVLLIDDASSIGVAPGDQVAVIRYGPEAVGAAWVVLAYFPGAQLVFDIARPGAVVDVVLGRGFVQLPTPTEVNQQIAANGRATAPPGTCAAG